MFDKMKNKFWIRKPLRLYFADFKFNKRPTWFLDPWITPFSSNTLVDTSCEMFRNLERELYVTCKWFVRNRKSYATSECSLLHRRWLKSIAVTKLNIRSSQAMCHYRKLKFAGALTRTGNMSKETLLYIIDNNNTVYDNENMYKKRTVLTNLCHSSSHFMQFPRYSFNDYHMNWQWITL